LPRGRGGMVDARDLKSLGRFPVRVRVPPSAPTKSRDFWALGAKNALMHLLILLNFQESDAS
jgi:hypothetical protein